MPSSRPLLCNRPSLALVVSVAMLLVPQVKAATLTFDSDGTTTSAIVDGNGSWNTTATNLVWSDGTTDFAWPNTASDVAIFGGGSTGSAGTVTVANGIVADSIIFNKAYTLNSGTISLQGPVPTVTANSAATINSALTATSFLKNGAGTLTINNANDNLGAITITAGMLDIFAKLVATDVLVSGTSTFGTHSGTTITMNSLTYNSTGNSNLASLAAGSTSTYTIGAGGLTMSAGTISINSGTGANPGGNPPTAALDATSNVTVQGALNMSGGTITLNTSSTGSISKLILVGSVNVTGNSTINTGGSAIGSRIVDLNGTVHTISVSDATVTFSLGGSLQNGGFTKTGAGNLLLNGSDANTYTGLTTISGGVVTLAKTAGITAIASDITVATGGALGWTNSNQIADTASILLSGGVLRMNGQSETILNLTQTAGNTNDGGGGNGGFLTINGFLRVSGGTTVNLNSGGQWTVKGLTDFTGFNGTALSTNGNGTRLSLFTAAGGMTLTGQKITLERGTASNALGSELALGGDVTASGTNSITFNAGNTFGVSQVNLGTGVRTFNVTSGTTTIDSVVVSLTAGDGVSNPTRTAVVGGINKTGTGTLQLNGANTYTGNTTIRAGTFKLGTAAASIDNTPLISVSASATYDVSAVTGYSLKSGQTLEGGGTVIGSTNGGVTALSGSTISGGTSGDSGTQTLSFTTNLTLNSGSVMKLDLSATGNEKLSITGTLTQGTGAKIVIGPETFTGALSIGQTFDFLDWTMNFSASSNLGPGIRNGSEDNGFDLDLPDISGLGMYWDTNSFATNGTIQVVPEPGITGLLAFGLGSLGLWRRRRFGSR